MPLTVEKIRNRYDCQMTTTGSQIVFSFRSRTSTVSYRSSYRLVFDIPSRTFKLSYLPRRMHRQKDASELLDRFREALSPEHVAAYVHAAIVYDQDEIPF